MAKGKCARVWGKLQTKFSSHLPRKLIVMGRLGNVGNQKHGKCKVEGY